MSTVKEAVDVDVDVRTAYNQWTRFEDFPSFMEGVEEVRQLDDRHNHWTTKIGGVQREFDTEIVDQMPGDRITWRSVGGDTRQRGSVRFERLDGSHTRVELTMDVEPTGVAEKGAGHARRDRSPGQGRPAPFQGLNRTARRHIRRLARTHPAREPRRACLNTTKTEQTRTPIVGLPHAVRPRPRPLNAALARQAAPAVSAAAQAAG